MAVQTILVFLFVLIATPYSYTTTKSSDGYRYPTPRPTYSWERRYPTQPTYYNQYNTPYPTPYSSYSAAASGTSVGGVIWIIIIVCCCVGCIAAIVQFNKRKRGNRQFQANLLSNGVPIGVPQQPIEPRVMVQYNAPPVYQAVVPMQQPPQYVAHPQQHRLAPNVTYVQPQQQAVVHPVNYVPSAPQQPYEGQVNAPYAPGMQPFQNTNQ
eukprot:1129841_1